MFVKDKVALITGRASGIGLACAEEKLKKEIAGVALMDVNEEGGINAMNELNGKYGEGKVIFVKANVTSKDEFEEAFKNTIDAFRQLDILLNNAGILDERNYENCLDVNLKGTTHGLRLAIDQYLPKHKNGKVALIVNTASLTGLMPYSGMEIYSSTKFGIVGLTRNFGCDYHYQRTGVKVIAICPDATVTPIMGQVAQNIIYLDTVQPMLDAAEKKSQTPEELAKSLIRILEDEDNGSVWLIQQGKETKIKFPSLF